MVFIVWRGLTSVAAVAVALCEIVKNHGIKFSCSGLRSSGWLSSPVVPIR